MNKDKRKSVDKRVLVYDIETSPLISRTWGLYDQNVAYLDKDFEILSFAYRWADEKTAHVVAQNDFKGKGDKALCKRLHKLLSEADIVMAHNGDRFDNKRVFARFVYHNLPAPTPFKTIDTLKICKKYFGFTSNKLNDVANFLGLGSKVKHPGIEMWIGCEAGKKSSWNIMKKYNKQDVNLLLKVWNRIKGYAQNQTPVHKGEGCPYCASRKTKSHGWVETKTQRYRRLMCLSCARVFREREADKTYEKPKYVGVG